MYMHMHSIGVLIGYGIWYQLQGSFGPQASRAKVAPRVWVFVAPAVFRGA